MPTLEDWMVVQADDGETTVVRHLFASRPDWLATGDVETRILVRFEPSDGGSPILLRWGEITLK